VTDGPSVCTVSAGRMRNADMTGRIPEENRIAACPLNGGLKGGGGGRAGQIITSTAGGCVLHFISVSVRTCQVYCAASVQGLWQWEKMKAANGNTISCSRDIRERQR